MTETPGTTGAPSREAHRVRIEYCTQCRWLPRAAWLAQELLTTFETELTELALTPGTGGVFVVRVDDEVVWDRREQGFPEPTAVKRLVRDRVAPGKPLGHSERPAE
ncbi:SelT/SelW/SelH family protein [Streptomyces sp. NPDC003631]|uniref:SelT/SelW/SelH family protein n=1 Tax=Streptomyces lannensis TaxID=766498 RepID=A0ABP7JIF2_9ACTN|nr:Rdx family protein [Streptomyces sp. WAC07094]